MSLLEGNGPLFITDWWEVVEPPSSTRWDPRHDYKHDELPKLQMRRQAGKKEMFARCYSLGPVDVAPSGESVCVAHLLIAPEEDSLRGRLLNLLKEDAQIQVVQAVIHDKPSPPSRVSDLRSRRTYEEKRRSMFIGPPKRMEVLFDIRFLNPRTMQEEMKTPEQSELAQH